MNSASKRSRTEYAGKRRRTAHRVDHGNRKLKRAPSSSPRSPRYPPDQPDLLRPKRADGKKRNAALICLARRRCDVLYAMLRGKAVYRHPPPRRTNNCLKPLDKCHRDTTHTRAGSAPILIALQRDTPVAGRPLSRS